MNKIEYRKHTSWPGLIIATCHFEGRKYAGAGFSKTQARENLLKTLEGLIRK